MRRTSALIVGGGPAGCAAALGLVRAGVEVELAERSEGPRDVVCGGFLGWDALASLERLGVPAAALGARPIRRLRLFSSGRRIEVPLPRPAAGLSRRTLDEALIGAAAAAGARVVRGRAARSADTETRRVRFDDGEEVEAKRLIVATGKHELRGAARPIEAGAHPIGLRTALRPSERLLAELAEVIELHLYDGGYAGLLLQEDGSANLCLSAAAALMKDAGGAEGLVDALARDNAPLAARVGEGEAGEWSAVANVPYGWRAKRTEENVFRVGDQAAVIASIAGDGIAIALESGLALGRAAAKGMPAPAFQSGWARRAARPVLAAEALRRAAEHPRPRQALTAVLGWFPALAPLFARLTRIA